MNFKERIKKLEDNRLTATPTFIKTKSDIVLHNNSGKLLVASGTFKVSRFNKYIIIISKDLFTTSIPVRSDRILTIY